MIICFHRLEPTKTFLSGIFLLLSISLNGQLSFEYDTIRIREVIITSQRTPFESRGFKKKTIDSAVISNYTHKNLAELLIQYSNIAIKSYGTGGSATPSFRGTGASHTRLTWNSINLNNPMLGQADLSLIPAGLIDEVNIYYGSSSMPAGSGGIGGMINLETKPVWRKETLLSFNPGTGSPGQYSGLLKVRTGNINFQSVTKAYFQYAENNFRYLNSVSSADPVWETRNNNQTLQKGFLQELYYRKINNVLSARVWYQSADRNLPSSILIQQPDKNENQSDKSVRTMISYDAYRGGAEYFLTGSFSASRLDYSNKLASIDSRNMSESVILKGGLINRPVEFIRTKVILDNEYTFVKSENYGAEKAGRNVASFTAIAELNSAGRIGATLLIREIMHGNTFLIPDFSSGLQVRITEGSDYFFKANYSRNSKLPSMNDLFWQPGGNPSLDNESANMVEIIYEMEQTLSPTLNSKFDISVYHNAIKDMIQWRPGNYSYWMADNIKNVNTSGLESSASINYTHNRISSSLNLSYAYTKATTTGSDILNDESVGKQLIYVPENQANASLRLTYLNLYSSWITGFTGMRYTSADNTSYLPGYILNSFSTGYLLHHKGNSYNINLTADNIFNKSYETISYYPQPGRTYSIKLLIQFLK